MTDLGFVTSFITGIAGVGKTYQIKKSIEDDPLFGILAASTGIAAINLNTVTINSLLKFFDVNSLFDAHAQGWTNREIRKIIKAGYKNIIIDEVSMLGNQVLDLIFRSIKEVNVETDNDLGLILSGDFLQLAPIKAQFAFEAECWEHFESNTTKLTKVYRQSDPKFLEALNLVRSGEPYDALDVLYSTGFKFEQKLVEQWDGTTIFSKNDIVDRYNGVKLMKINAPKKVYKKSTEGVLASDWKRIPEEVEIKPGAYVMILTNHYREICDDRGRVEDRVMEYANGDCGIVREVDDDGIHIALDRNGEVVYVPMLTRDNVVPELPDLLKKTGTQGVDYFPKEFYDPEKKAMVQVGWIIGTVTFLPVRLAWASTVHKCVLPSTLVYTSNGVVEAANVNSGDAIWDGTDYKIVKSKENNNAEIWRLKTYKGYELLASGNHPILTPSGEFIFLSDLHEGDSITISTSPAYAGYAIVPQDLMWFYGVMIGDGTYRDKRDGIIAICTSDKGIQKRVADVLMQEGIKTTLRSDGQGIYCVSKPFRQKLFQMGFDYSLAIDKEIPQVLMETNMNHRCALLQGLFDTDGHVSSKRIVYATSSSKLAKQVHILLQSVGVQSRLRKYKGKKRDYFQITISRANMPEFESLIGFSREYKDLTLKSIPEPKHNTYKFLSSNEDLVETVERTGIWTNTIDLEVDGGVFVADGIVTHNTQGLSLDAVQIDIRDHFFSAPSMLYVAMSRARTLDRLRVVGNEATFLRRCKVDEKVARYI